MLLHGRPWRGQPGRMSCWRARARRRYGSAEPPCRGSGFFLQPAKEVTILYERGPNIRHIYMNVPHTRNPAPSWLGESVGHYEGSTLVIDTIGLNDKTFIDNYRTPHTTQLHVVERYTVSED